MTILTHDDIAAMNADILLDADKGRTLMRMLCIGHVHNGGEVIIDGYAPGALYAETESRPGMWDLGPADGEVDEWIENDPNWLAYCAAVEGVAFQLPAYFYSVLPMEQREDWVGA